MKKIFIGITGLLCGTTHCVHLALNTPQKIDFTNKRIILIEKYISQKLSEKADLEQKLLTTAQAQQDSGARALLQAKLLAINTDITELQNSMTLAKNSIQSLTTH